MEGRLAPAAPKRATTKQQLVTAIRERLFPERIALGYANIAGLDQVQARGYVFRRSRSEYKDEIRFWWDKYGRPSFLLQFITTAGALMDSLPSAYSTSRTKVHVAALSATQSVRSLLAGGPKWFHVSRIVSLASRAHAIASVVDEASERLVEIDDFFKNGTVSRHFQH